jgi:hypothetical protein
MKLEEKIDTYLRDLNKHKEKQVSQKDIDKFFNKTVVITQNKTGAKYEGKLSYISKSKGFIVLDNMRILDKQGNVKVASKKDTKREFKISEIKIGFF